MLQQLRPLQNNVCVTWLPCWLPTTVKVDWRLCNQTSQVVVLLACDCVSAASLWTFTWLCLCVCNKGSRVFGCNFVACRWYISCESTLINNRNLHLLFHCTTIAAFTLQQRAEIWQQIISLFDDHVYTVLSLTIKTTRKKNAADEGLRTTDRVSTPTRAILRRRQSSLSQGKCRQPWRGRQSTHIYCRV